MKITHENEFILLNDDELKSKICQFLGNNYLTEEGNVMFNIIRQSYKNHSIEINFSLLPFYWLAGFLSGLAFLYRRLWLPFIISSIIFISLTFLQSYIVFKHHNVEIFVLLYFVCFIGSIVLFGKLYYWFLIKKFINSLNNGYINNNCSNNNIGVIILLSIFLLAQKYPLLTYIF